MCRRFLAAEHREVDDAIPDAGREVILMPVTNFGEDPRWRYEGYLVPRKVQTSGLY